MARVPVTEWSRSELDLDMDSRSSPACQSSLWAIRPPLVFIRGASHSFPLSSSTAQPSPPVKRPAGVLFAPFQFSQVLIRTPKQRIPH